MRARLFSLPLSRILYTAPAAFLSKKLGGRVFFCCARANAFVDGELRSRALVFGMYCREIRVRRERQSAPRGEKLRARESCGRAIFDIAVGAGSLGRCWPQEGGSNGECIEIDALSV